MIIKLTMTMSSLSLLSIVTDHWTKRHVGSVLFNVTKKTQVGNLTTTTILQHIFEHRNSLIYTKLFFRYVNLRYFPSLMGQPMYISALCHNLKRKLTLVFAG